MRKQLTRHKTTFSQMSPSLQSQGYELHFVRTTLVSLACEDEMSLTKDWTDVQ